MDKNYEIKYYSEEESNWWFVARRNTILNLLKRINKSAVILDIGCGGGPLLLELKAIGFLNVYGIDISENAIQKCKERGLDNVFVMDGHCPQFETGTFDVIISSDSLEHLKNDIEALSNWHKLLKKGGSLFIFVPAFMFLWSEHDLVNHHYRRYTSGLLKSKVKQANFFVVKKSYWNFFIFFPVALYRVTKKWLSAIRNKRTAPKDQLRSFSPFINKILIKVLSFENLFFTTTGLIVGVSAFVHAKKK